jgi:HEAT repeat protein
MVDPAGDIEAMVEERRTASDPEVLAELRALEPLPPEGDRGWESDDLAVWRRGYLLVALAAVAAERGLHEAVPLVLERMCDGDPGEIMRGMRTSLEEAVAGDWPLLMRYCIEACAAPSPGTRYWAVDELAVLREPAAVPTLMRALQAPVDRVAEAAAFALNLTARDHAACRAQVHEALREAGEQRRNPRLLREADEVEGYSRTDA